MPCLIDEWLFQEMRFIKWNFTSKSIVLEPCIEEADLIEIEQTYKLRFPADYRLYLLEIGNGVGTGGPCREGILQFGMTPFGYPLGFSDLSKLLAKPFPYTEKNIAGAEHRNNINSYDQETAFNLQMAQTRHRHVGGYVTLGTSMNSLNHFWIFICEGICRGEVWIVTWQGNFYPCTPRMTLKDWLVDCVENGGFEAEKSLMNTHDYPASYTRSSATNDYSEEEEEEEQMEEEPVLIYRRRGATTTLL